MLIMSKSNVKISDRWRGLSGKSKRRILAITYSIILLGVLTPIAYNYRAPAETESDNNFAEIQKNANTNAFISQVREASLAVQAANLAGLSVANNVTERSISYVAKNQLAQKEETIISKPVLSIDDTNIALVSYVVVEGDTVASVAVKFGITAQTVKWANNLTGDTLAVGTALTLPVADGVVYTVKDGETIDAIVNKYGSTASAVLAQNNLIDIKSGDKILIPGGNLPANERPGYVAPTPARTSTGTTVGSGSAYNGVVNVGNRYSYGYCTWYAYNRRAELGRPIGSFWGNANTWDNRARAAGWTVSNIPIAGAVFQTDAGWAGHVGVVESVNPDGTINISDMNGIAGWNRVGYRNGVSPYGYVYIY
jgi:surface antigen